MKLDNLKKYSSPFVITITGYDGENKLKLARDLSKKLKIFLLSNDYVRNYYLTNNLDYKTVQDKVRDINDKRISILKNNQLSFVYDMNFNNKDCFEKVNDYNVVKIRLYTDDNKNVKSIMLRKYEPDKVIDGVLGDNTKYESYYDENTYYEIKERKKIELDDSYFDYIIREEDSLDEKINNIIEDIEKRFSWFWEPF